MENPEIISGLKNAVERGDSLEKAKQSFINAGYSKQDVEESSKVLGTGVMSKMPEGKVAKGEIQLPKKKSMFSFLKRKKLTAPAEGAMPPKAQASTQVPTAPATSNPTSPPPAKKSKLSSNKTFIILLVILLILVGILTVYYFSL